MTAAGIDRAPAVDSDPPRGVVRGVLRLVRGVLSDVYQEFIVASLRSGVLRLRGLSAGFKAVVWISSALILGTSLAILSADRWRSGAGLPLTTGTGGRITVVPAGLVPVTLFLVAVATALILAGATRCRAAVKWSVLAVYAAVAAFFLANALVASTGLTPTVGWGGLVVAIGWFIATRWTPDRPTIDTIVLLGCTAATFGAAYAGVLDLDRAASSSLGAAALNVSFVQVTALTFPMLLLAGLSTVSFGASVATWSLGVAERRATTAAIAVVVGILGAWRIRDLVVETRAAGYGLVAPLVGAVVLVAVVALAWALLGARRAEDQPVGADADPAKVTSLARGQALGLVLVLPLAGLVAAVALVGATGLAAVVPDRHGAGVLDAGLEVVDVATSDGARHASLVLFGLVALALAVRQSRAGRQLLAGFLATVGVVGIANWAFGSDGPLDRWAWTSLTIDLLIQLILVAMVATFLYQREMTVRRLDWLAFALLLTILIRQGGFLADPFAPFLGFAGVGFVLFGIFWGWLTGRSWANQGSDRFPRTSRIALLLGYELFSVTLLLWFAASHEVGSVTTISGTAKGSGFAYFGLPLLYALLAVALISAWRDLPLVKTDPQEGEEPGAKSGLVADPTRPGGRA